MLKSYTRNRIILVFRDLGTGGAQKIEAFVANLLYENNNEVIVINMASTPCSVNLNHNIKIVNVLYDRVEKCKNYLIKYLYKLIYLIKFRYTIIKLKPDLVISFLSDVVRVTTLALFGTKIKIIGSERGDPFAFTQRQFYNYKKVYNKCSGVVFQLPYVKKIYDLPESTKQVVIPNPCIPRNNTFFKWIYNESHIIFSAGRLCYQKRFDLLISAFDKIYKNHNEYKLIIYGNGPLRYRLQNQIDNCQYARNAIFLFGDVKDVFQSAHKFEFFVLSSDYEGIPNILLEAMAMGIPCISTDCSPGGARYLLGDNERGLIVPCDNSDLLVQAMEEYINNPNLRKLLGAKSKTVLNDFEPVKIKTLWLNFIEDVMDKKS